MKAVLNFIRNEPAMVVTVVLAITNAIVDLNAGQADAVKTIVESLILLAGGGVVRQSVTPVSKLKGATSGS